MLTARLSARAPRLQPPPPPATLRRQAGAALIPPGHDAPLAGPAPFLWLYAIAVPLVVLTDRTATGARWWATFALLGAALVALALRYRGTGDWRLRPLVDGLVNVGLLAGVMMAALWCAAGSNRLLFLFGGVIHLVAVLAARVHSGRDTAVVIGACYSAVFGVTWWSHALLAPAQALDPWNVVLVSWATGLAAGATNHLTAVVRGRLAAQEREVAEAAVDSLTGMANRRAFLAALERSLERACREGMRSTVIIADLDGLKDINDSFGHAAGDAALRRMAGALGACARPGDIVARLGGDEFALLTTHPVGTPAEAITARFIAALEGTVLDDVPGGRAMLLSASWGAATSGMDGGDVAALLAVADEALLRHKATARPPRPAGAAEGGLFVPRGRRALAEALGSMFDLARDLATADHGEEFLRRAATRAADLVGVNTAAVAIVRGQHRRGYRAVREAGSWHYLPARFPEGRTGIFAHVMETGRPYVSNDLSADPVADPAMVERLRLESCVCVPLRGTDGAVVGTVFLSNKLGGAPFTDQDVSLATAFADLAAVALEKAEALAAAHARAEAAEASLRAARADGGVGWATV